MFSSPDIFLTNFELFSFSPPLHIVLLLFTRYVISLSTAFIVDSLSNSNLQQSTLMMLKR